MPYRDPEKRRQSRLKYARSRSEAYHKWLYERRAFRFWKAAKFEEILTTIARQENNIPPHQLAQAWIDEAEQTEREVGNRFDHEQDKPYYIPDRTDGRVRRSTRRARPRERDTGGDS